GESPPPDVAGDETAADRPDRAGVRKPGNLVVQPRCHDRHGGAGLAHQPELARPRFAAADDQDGLALEGEKCRKMLQRTPPATINGPTENVRGALALGDAGASCPIKSRGSARSGGPGPKQKIRRGWYRDGVRHRFS